jgi:hypothetical protein
VNREECSERIRLVDEYSRLITEFNELLESLKAPSHERKEGVWSAAATARAESQAAWQALEKHITQHNCFNSHEQNPEGKRPGSASSSPLGALIEDLAHEVPDDPYFETVRTDLLSASRSDKVGQEKDLTLRLFLAIRSLLREHALLKERLRRVLERESRR